MFDLSSVMLTSSSAACTVVDSSAPSAPSSAPAASSILTEATMEASSTSACLDRSSSEKTNVASASASLLPTVMESSFPQAQEGGSSNPELASILSMTSAALSAKNIQLQTLLETNNKLSEERTNARRMIEAAEEDSGFLRAQMENVLTEKTRLQQTNAALTRECANLRLERGILRGQVEEFADVLGGVAQSPASPTPTSLGETVANAVEDLPVAVMQVLQRERSLRLSAEAAANRAAAEVASANRRISEARRELEEERAAATRARRAFAEREQSLLRATVRARGVVPTNDTQQQKEEEEEETAVKTNDEETAAAAGAASPVVTKKVATSPLTSPEQVSKMAEEVRAVAKKLDAEALAKAGKEFVDALPTSFNAGMAETPPLKPWNQPIQAPNSVQSDLDSAKRGTSANEQRKYKKNRARSAAIARGAPPSGGSLSWSVVDPLKLKDVTNEKDAGLASNKRNMGQVNALTHVFDENKPRTWRAETA